MGPLCYGYFLGYILFWWHRLTAANQHYGRLANQHSGLHSSLQNGYKYECFPEEFSIFPGSIQGGSMFILVGTSLGCIRTFHPENDNSFREIFLGQYYLPFPKKKKDHGINFNDEIK